MCVHERVHGERCVYVEKDASASPVPSMWVTWGTLFTCGATR